MEQKPSIGRIVRYVRKQGVGAVSPAIVTVDASTYIEHAESVALDSDTHAHLWVFTTKSRTDHEVHGAPGIPGFHEMNIPYDPSGAPGTWHWPTRS
jgi:hypothetical protein